MKKILSIFIITILLLSSISFVGCSGVSYRMYLCVIVNGEEYILTEENPLQNINSIIYPSPYIKICPNIIIENNKGKIVYREGIYEFYKDDEFNVQTDYLIIGADDIEKEGKLNRASLYLYKDLLEQGFMEIENSPGMHNLYFTIPENDKYKTKKTTFSLSIEYNENIKSESVKVVRQRSNSSENQEIIENNKIYSVYKNEMLIFNHIDAQTNEYVDGSLTCYYRKLDENYFWNMCNEFDAKVGRRINETGIYMCVLSYQNNSSSNYNNSLIEFYVSVK